MSDDFAVPRSEPILASRRLEMYDCQLSDECAAELLRRNPGRVVIAWSQ